MKLIQTLGIAFGASLISPLAQAHDNNLSMGLVAGLGHPVTGIDHLVALVLSGVLVGRLVGGKRRVLAGLVCALGLGATGGILLGAQTGIESLILLSLPVLFACQWLRQPGHLKTAITFMGLFMVAHGWAHGVEASGMTQGFVAGFLLTSALVMGLSSRVSYALSFRRMPESRGQTGNSMDSGIRRNDGSLCPAPKDTLTTDTRSHLVPQGTLSTDKRSHLVPQGTFSTDKRSHLA